MNDFVADTTEALEPVMVETEKTGETEQRSLPVRHGNGQAELVRRSTMALFEALDPRRQRGRAHCQGKRRACSTCGKGQLHAGRGWVTCADPAPACCSSSMSRSGTLPSVTTLSWRQTTGSPSGTAWGRAQRTLARGSHCTSLFWLSAWTASSWRIEQSNSLLGDGCPVKRGRAWPWANLRSEQQPTTDTEVSGGGGDWC